VTGIKNKMLAGAGGLEPPNGGIKIRCLTTWLRPKTCTGESCAELGRPQVCRTIAVAPYASNGAPVWHIGTAQSRRWQPALDQLPRPH
jgi:hypothetical protein